MSLELQILNTSRCRPTSFYDLPPEIRCIIYTYALRDFPYSAQAYYPLLHLPRPFSWHVPDFLPGRVVSPNDPLNLLWEFRSQNHGFAYSNSVRQNHAPIVLAQHDLLKVSSFIHDEASQLVPNVVPPPLAIWRDFLKDTQAQMMNFLSFMSIALHKAGICTANITSLHIHSQLTLQSCHDLAYWIRTSLPALNSLHLITDVTPWHARAQLALDSLYDSPPRRTFWHLHHSRPWHNVFGRVVQDLMPLASLATHISTLHITIIVPRGGICQCSDRFSPRPRRARGCAERCPRSHLIEGDAYAAAQTLYLQAMVAMFEVAWFALVKGGRRGCMWPAIVGWAAEQLRRRETLPNVYGALLHTGGVDGEGLAEFDPEWLRRLTGLSLIHI